MPNEEKKKRPGRPRKVGKRSPGRPPTRVTREDLKSLTMALEHQGNTFERRLRNLENHRLPARVEALEAQMSANLVETQQPLAAPTVHREKGIALYFPPVAVRDMVKWLPLERLILALHTEAVPIDATNIEAFLQLNPVQQSVLLNGTLAAWTKEEDAG